MFVFAVDIAGSWLQNGGSLLMLFMASYELQQSIATLKGHCAKTRVFVATQQLKLSLQEDGKITAQEIVVPAP